MGEEKKRRKGFPHMFSAQLMRQLLAAAIPNMCSCAVKNPIQPKNPITAIDRWGGDRCPHAAAASSYLTCGTTINP
eukprot:360078-Chlamydomonas_euryale.AAC.13